ncbi:GGDEF domain-containing protein [Litoreibacter arenae]|uniref:Sensory box/GGDEF family protein n=1 Tax=Litoreibacter arenae DSM 19593 TaxID=1123360 RepID=S9QHS6_9RHOB|nr:GGDEF domain-containing protein [Litoreibacter arenae]EPX81011.1 Sensory box/GGDEF family protein [Litoreibacter arenae DSM 19593]
MNAPPTPATPRCYLPMEAAALGALMPMHLHVSATGHILSVGPTLAKLRPDEQLSGRRLLELFEIKRPQNIRSYADLVSHGSCLVRARFRHGDQLGLKGLFVPLPAAQDPLQPDRREADDAPPVLRPLPTPPGDAACGGLLNLSLGVNVVEAVQRYNLNSADFAPADPTVDMLYLIEAKSVALEESKRLNARLEGARSAAEVQALTDTLTGLQNRRGMDLVLQQLASSGQAFGLMHLDLDHFKQVNDTFGHGAGDHVLRHVAGILQDETRASDMVARVGGDEFVLIFQGCVDLPVLEGIAWRIIARLEEPVAYDGHLCRISASIGTTLSSFYTKPVADRMLNDADEALYASKNQGRACHTVFKPQQASRIG